MNTPADTAAPSWQELTSTELASHSGAVIDRVRYEGARLVITRNGNPACAIVPLSDLARLKAASATAGDAK